MTFRLHLSQQQAFALGQSTRWDIMKILDNRELSAFEIMEELHLPKNTTVRHHLKLLEQAHLIEMVRMEPKQGSFEKYYTANFQLVKPRI